MVRSRIAVIAIALTTLLPGVALAAPQEAAPAACDMCGAPFNDLNQGPFARRDYITSVEPYRVTDTNIKRTWTTLEGAIVKVRAAPGVTREWLQSAVNDHVGRMAGAGAMSDCPLSVTGASADVSSTGDGFAITIHSKDKDAAQEILRRANGLLAR